MCNASGQMQEVLQYFELPKCLYKYSIQFTNPTKDIGAYKQQSKEGNDTVFVLPVGYKNDHHQQILIFPCLPTRLI